jgi:Tol biopolymer transport system component
VVTPQQAYEYALNQERAGNPQAAFETLVDLNRQYPHFADVEARLANYTSRNFRYYGQQSFFATTTPPPPAYPVGAIPPPTSPKKGKGGLIALLIGGLVLLIAASGALLYLLVFSKNSTPSATLTVAADPLAPTLTAISKISVAPQATTPASTTATGSSTAKATTVATTPTTAATTFAPTPTAKPTTPPATTSASGFKPLTSVSGIKEVPLDPQIMKATTASMSKIPDFSMKMYVSTDIPESLAKNLHSSFITTNYTFAGLGETEPFAADNVIIGAYAQNDTPDLVFTVYLLTTNRDDNKTILADIPGLTPEIETKILDQMKGYSSFVIAMSGTGLNIMLFSGGSTPTPTATPMVLGNPTYNRKVVYTSTRNGKNAVYLYDFAKRVEIALSEPSFACSEAVWSLLGSEIYLTCRDSIYVVSPDGSGFRKIEDGTQPHPSPLKGFVFVNVIKDDCNGVEQIYFRHFNGPNERLTCNSNAKLAPRVSPDGAQIVYAEQIGGKWQLVIIDVAGGENRHVLNPNVDNARYPTWSPDGTKLAFSTGDGKGINAQIYVLNLKDNSLTQLTTEGFNGRPSWMKQGYIIFHSNRDFASNRNDDGTPDQALYLMQDDGSHQERMPLTSSEDNWAPDIY